VATTPSDGSCRAPHDNELSHVILPAFHHTLTIGWARPIDKTGEKTTKLFAGLGTQHSKELWEQLNGLENIGFKQGEEFITRSLDCPAVGIFELLSQLGGIPTIASQGIWTRLILPRGYEFRLSRRGRRSSVSSVLVR